MAKAKAICKCEKCGKTFEKEKICANRREAESWEAWAEENCTVCPECYAAEKASKLEATHDIREMHYGEYKEKFPECKTVPGSYDPKTKMIKVYIPKEAHVEEAKPEEKASPANAEKEKEFVQALNKFFDVLLRIEGFEEHSRRIEKSGKYFIAELYCTDSSGFHHCITICPQRNRYTDIYCADRDGRWQPFGPSYTLSPDLLKKIVAEMQKS